MKRFIVFVILLAAASALAQNESARNNEDRAFDFSTPVTNSPPGHDYERDEVRSPWAPGIHPWFEPDMFSGGGGFGPGLIPTGGVDYVARRFEIALRGSYGLIRKTNDNDQVANEHGYTRDVGGDAYYRLQQWFLGGGASWGETAVTPYRKYAWAPEISGGRTFFYHSTDLRIQTSWSKSLREYTDYPNIVQFTPGPGQPQFSTYCICNNGGIDYNFDIWISMTQTGHFLIHGNFGAQLFHETVTDPYNKSLTAAQDADHEHAFAFSTGLQFRF